MADLALQQPGNKFSTITLIGGTSQQAEDLATTLLNVPVRVYLISDSTGLITAVHEYITTRLATGTKYRTKIVYTATITDAA